MANAIQHANGPLPQAANCTLTGSIAASGGGTVTVSSAAFLPAKGPFLVVVDNERLEVDSISGTTLTFLAGGRGLEGSSAAAHSSGASVYQVLSAANLARVIDDRTGVVLAPDPTGVAATDKSNLDALTSTANRIIQLRPGTYLCNPLADLAAGVVLRGWPAKQTTIKLAVQTNERLLTLGVGGGLDGLVLDGDRANQTSVWAGYQGMVGLASAVKIRDCTVQNVKSTMLICFGTQMLEIPTITSVTTSTSGGSLAATTQWWYRITATSASGGSQPSNEVTVTTGAGATNSNTLRWRKVAGATGYKVYAASTAANQWHEQLLATIGSGSTLTYTHTTGSGSGLLPAYDASSSVVVTDVEITDNVFTNCGHTAVYGELGCHRWLVARNRFTLIAQDSVYIKGAIEGTFTHSDDCTVTENFIDYSQVTADAAVGTTAGIELWNRVPRCIVTDNHIIGPRDDSDAFFIGISLGGAGYGSICTGNTVEKSNPNGADDAINLGLEVAGSPGCVVNSNTVTGAQVGIAISGADFNSGGVDQCTIVGNKIKQCAEYGIQVTEGSGHTISGNTFIDAGKRYIFLNGFQKDTLSCAVVGNVCFIASNNRAAADSGSMKAIYIVNSGRQTVVGNVCGPLPPIVTPAAPTVTPQGTPGSTTYTYVVTAVNEYGETVASPTGSTATGNATLNGSNFNRLTWAAVPSSSGYRIYRTVGGGSAGLIGYGQWYGTITFDDTGIAADTTITAPATGTTGGTSTVGLDGLYFQGSSLIESCIISGNRFDGAAPVGATLPNDAITFADQVDYTQVTGNFARNYARSFIYTVGTPAANPNYVQFNITPGIPLPHVQGNGPKFSDIVRRSEEVQRLAGGVWLADDFTGGLLTTGNIGDLGWQFLNGTAPSVQAAVASHSGIIRLDSSASSGTRQYFWCGASVTVGQVLPADWFHLMVMFRMNTTDANTLFRVGLGNSANADPPADGIYIEKVAADTSWFGVTRASASQTRTSALATVTAAQWVKATIRRVTTTQIGFSISTSFAPDNGTEALLTATIPTAALVPYMMIGNSAAASKTADIDYVELNVQNMSR